MHASRFLSRRSAVAAIAAAAVPVARAQAPGDGPLRIGQSTALTGPLGELGSAMHQGAVACFSALNAQGGVAGRKIELVTLDDAYQVPRAVANVEQLMADPATFALFNCMGTPCIEAMLPKVTQAGIPFFAPFTGALVARTKARTVFNIRASYPEEAEQLIQHLATLGIRRIAIAHQANTFGQEVLDGARRALTKFKLPEAPTASVQNDASDAAKAAETVAAAQPEAVLLGLAGKPTLEFVKAIRARQRGLPLYAVSVLGSASTLKALGPDGVGIAVAQVVPSPNNQGVPVVRDFHAAWKASGTPLEPSHLALEGYINARVFAEAVRRAGRGAPRERFVDAVWGMKQYDAGGFDVAFTEPGRNASRFVELTLVGRDGRFLR